MTIARRFLVVAVILSTLSVVTVSPTASAVSSEAPTPLPPGFLWGVASSGFQSEGSSPDSNWLRYQHTAHGDHIGTSVDFRHRYRHDIALAKGLGVKVYRISIEWARVEPRPGVVDQRELAYYDAVLAAIVAAGMRPMITLDHWVYPGWVAQRGGWANPAIGQLWLRNARRVVDRYGRYHPLWITINEPMYYIVQEIRHGGLTPADAPAMLARLIDVHRSIYRYIHRRDPHAMVSSNAAYIPTVRAAADAPFLDRVRDTLDYVGVDYYYSASVQNPQAWYAAIDETWRAPVAADGLYYALRDYARRFPSMPLYVVESGMPTDNGAPRPDGYRRGDHLRDLVYWLQRARGAGIHVIGYNYWSLTDNYEWGSYTPRFGLYTVNVKTDPQLVRRPTDAVAAYRGITANDGVPPSYRPTRPAEFCSLVTMAESCRQPAN